MLGDAKLIIKFGSTRCDAIGCLPNKTFFYTALDLLRGLRDLASQHTYYYILPTSILHIHTTTYNLHTYNL